MGFGSMDFDPSEYGSSVARIPALDGNGQRLIPLVAGTASSEDARRLLEKENPKALFPRSARPKAAFAGLWLYFSCLERAHEIAQDDSSAEGSFWHAILHRQEPDSGNSAYWFRRVGSDHPVFALLTAEAIEIIRRWPDAEFRVPPRWDPFAFILFCERARQQPGSVSERAALEIQRAEWQLLFHHCAKVND